MLLEELHLLDVHPLLIAGVLLLQLFDLRLQALHLLHALHRLVLEREGQDLHRQREQDDGDAPVVRRHDPVEELHHREEHARDHRPEAEIDRLLQRSGDGGEVIRVLGARVDDERLVEGAPRGEIDRHLDRGDERPVAARF